MATCECILFLSIHVMYHLCLASQDIYLDCVQTEADSLCSKRKWILNRKERKQSRASQC